MKNLSKFILRNPKLKKYNKLIIPLILFHIIMLVLLPFLTARLLKVPAIKKLFNINESRYEVRAEEIGKEKEDNCKPSIYDLKIDKCKPGMEKEDKCEVLISEDGYVFSVNELYLDKERMFIKGSVSGPELIYKDGIFPADVELVPKDFKESSTAEGGRNLLNEEEKSYSFQFEEKYKAGEVEKFLALNKKYITLDVMIYRRKDIEGKTILSQSFEEGIEKEREYRVFWPDSDESIKEFKAIKIPFVYKAY